MKILLDTHIFLWTLASPERIDPKKLQQIESPANTIYVSSVSVAEIMIKVSIGKLAFPYNPNELIKESDFEPLDFSGEDALLLRDLPFHHKDPFDRMLIAQSITRKIPILTDDEKFRFYDCTQVG